MAVWEELRTYFGSNRRNLAESHSTCANIKKAHSLRVWLKDVYSTLLYSNSLGVRVRNPIAKS